MPRVAAPRIPVTADERHLHNLHPSAVQARCFCCNCFLAFLIFTPPCKNKKKPSSCMQGAAKASYLQMGSASGSYTCDGWKMGRYAREG